jgi:hypothetical protein
MTTHVDNNVVWRANTTTEYYNCILKLSQAFDAVGVVKTADTGQVNLVGPTLALPGTLDTTYRFNHFEMRKLQRSGYPTIYIRIDYGARQPSGSFIGSYTPCVKITTGTGTDGAGTLSGPGRQQAIYSGDGYYAPSYATPAAPRPIFVASDGQNYFTCVLDPSIIGPVTQSNALVPLGFAIERCISASTISYDTDSYLLIGHCTSGVTDNQAGFTSTYMTIINIESLSFIDGASVPVQAPVGLTSSKLPGQTLIFPITVCTPKIKMPAKSCLYHFKTDIPAGQQFTTSFYGETRNYLSLATFGYNNSAINATNVGPAILFE